MKRLLTFAVVFLAFASMAYAADGCCEKTSAGEWCSFTSQDNCAADAKFLPTTCDQTSYCKIGCCVSSDEGRCFKNTPRSVCLATGATWTEAADCAIDQCAKGCCILGDQAFFVSEVKCKQTATDFPDVTMVYDKGVKSEQECLAKTKGQEMGCCVKSDGCVFTNRASCSTAATLTGNSTEGFYKDMLCSNDKLNCGCARQQTTGCVGEDVYWFDSCGNRENIYNVDKSASYNKGFVLPESASCKSSSAYDKNCGNCEYMEGRVCGEDKGKVMPFGKFTCIDLNCRETFNDEDISPNADGKAKRNGESWCVYDSLPGQARDLVGSRHYRHLCVNGEEIVEPCKDFREEICVQGVIDEPAKETFNALTDAFGEGKYIESACRLNRHKNCYACNNLYAEEVEKTGLTPTIIEKRKKCCNNEDVRDCYWLPAAVKGTKEGVDGTCVPQVPPGLKFWGDAPKSQKDADKVAEDKGASTSTPKNAAETVCAQANMDCTVVYQRPGLARTGLLGKIVRWTFLIRPTEGSGGDTWKIVAGKECVSKTYVDTGNAICRSMGDCGAYMNIRGQTTMDGYYNSLVDEDGFNVDGSKFKLREGDVANEAKLLKGIGLKPGEAPGAWSSWRSEGPVMLYFAAGTALLGGAVSAGKLGWTWEAFGKGATPFSAVVDAGSKGVRWGGVFSSGWTSADLAKKGMTGFSDKFVLEPGKKITEETIIKEAFTEDTKKEIIQRGQDALKQAAEKTSNSEALEKAGQDALNSEAKKRLTEMETKGMLDKEGVVKADAGSGWMSALQTYMWVRTVVQLIDIIATETETVQYKIDCKPWQPPSGGDDCETCNDKNKPCSEYKCMSLGASCKLVNKGSANETCVAVDANDVNSPVLKPWNDVLTPPYTLEVTEEQGNPGYKLKEKVPPFKPITVGIESDEPATCKYDVKPGTKYESMPSTFGSSLLLYKQQVTFSLPSELAQKNVTKVNKGEYAMYIRCKDANGNENERDYFIKFKIDDAPDLTPPSIRFTSIADGSFISAGTTEMPLSIYVDEPAECKWSRRDVEYEMMENAMQCATNALGQNTLYYGTFECTTRLGNLTRMKNVFFIRCNDKPGYNAKDRNTMSESFKMEIHGTTPLNITKAYPDGNIFYTKDVTMSAWTANGAEQGKANCGFSPSDTSFANMILFEKTGGTEHQQKFIGMDSAKYDYYISCMDKAGNEATARINFTVTVDSAAPILDMVYIDSMLGVVHLEFNEKCTCEFSDKATFAYGEGKPIAVNETAHDMALGQSVYYVKCIDMFGNKGDYVIHPEITIAS